MTKKKNIFSKKEKSDGIGNNNNWLWSIVFVIIALMSIWAVVSQSSSFSIPEFLDYIREASNTGLIAAFLSMLCFILFEALALLLLCRALGHKKGLWNGFIYSASDIYFSAITPSATGGQPASAYFMMKDGMDSMLTTTALIVNLCMYTLSVVVIGIISFILGFDIFTHYTLVSKILIAGGLIIQIGLVVFFVLILFNEKLLHRICSSAINILGRLKMVKRVEERQAKLTDLMNNYRNYAVIISGHRKTLFFVFLFNMIQRIAQIAVTMFVYMATTGAALKDSFNIAILQAYTTIGSYVVPMPGGIGVTDYLMFDGFGNLMCESEAVKLQLLSRSMSFYFCVFICGISVLIQYFIVKKRSAKP